MSILQQSHTNTHTARLQPKSSDPCAVHNTRGRKLQGQITEVSQEVSARSDTGNDARLRMRQEILPPQIHVNKKLLIQAASALVCSKRQGRKNNINIQWSRAC